jgi:putative peptidoglycan lipid II flippase
VQGFTFRLQSATSTPDLRKLAIIAAPAMLAGGVVVQISNLLVGRQSGLLYDSAMRGCRMPTVASTALALWRLRTGCCYPISAVVDWRRSGRWAQRLWRASELALALTIPAAVRR